MSRKDKAPLLLKLVLIVQALAVMTASQSIAAHGRGLERSKPTVLVTGAAGFIGSHLSKRLQESGEFDVVGLDIFNTYYTPALKWQRVESLLVPAGVKMIEGDVCNDTLIAGLMQEHRFTAVVHLAAQAGVRYSLKKPQAYVRENVQCFVALLEQIRAVSDSGRPAPQLLYASSSSVYGLSEAIPFTETDRVDKLSNLYGATKRMNEITAFAYHNLFNLSSVGFRFFTVYGPWGRPDMAAYLFSDNILKGSPITVFNEGKLLRDFTYVDDIVSGLVAALRLPHGPPLVINLGNNKPVQVMDFIQMLQDMLGKKAAINWAVSKAEMPITFANISLAQKLLGYDPKTTIDVGLKQFVDWYKGYEQAAVPCESECAVLPEMCFASGWAAALQASIAATKDCNVVIYTASLSNPSQFTPWPYKPVKGAASVCTVAFVKKGAYRVSARRRLSAQWKIIEVAGLKADMTDERLLRILKLTPGKFFAPSVEYAIFISAKLELRMHVSKLLELLKPFSSDGKVAKVAMMVVRNPQAQDAGEHNNALLAKQLGVYEKYRTTDGICFPQFYFDDAIVVHDLKSVAGSQLRCDWYREFQQWSSHDQVAGAFTLASAAVGVGGGSQKICSAMAASNDHSSDDVFLLPISKSKDGVEYVRMLPNKLYHWHFTENLAKELRR